jgi:hypothetical protein
MPQGFCAALVCDGENFEDTEYPMKAAEKHILVQKIETD